MLKTYFLDALDHYHFFTLTMMFTLTISQVTCLSDKDLKEVPIAKYPYVALLSIRRTTGATGKCSGVLIAANSILTAASCLYNVLPKKVVAYTGVTDRSKFTQEAGVQERPSKYLVYHPGYCPLKKCNGTLSGYNLGVVRTKKPFQLTSYCQFARLQYTWIDYSNFTVAMVGWYFTHHETSEQKWSLLHRLRTQVLADSEVCNLLPSHAICIHQKDHEHLIGEAGSPLIYKGRVIGVRGYRTLSMNKSILTYENVFMFRHWIQCAWLRCDANFYRRNRSVALNLLQFFLLSYYWFDL
ncbi:hypothetical protein Trydic_g2738 [Trypoxylus dichotomus]